MLRNLIYQLLQWKALGMHRAVASIWNIMDTLSGALLLAINPLYVSVRIMHSRVSSTKSYK